MLRFFRINDPYRLLAILVLIALFALPFLIKTPPLSLQELQYLLVGENVAAGHMMYVQIYDSTAPFASGVFGLTDLLFGRSLIARDVLAILMLFFQAAFFAVLLINNKAYNDSTYVPGLILALLCFISYDFMTFTPELFASTLLLLALNNLFKEIEFRIEREEIVLNLGVYLGAASIFVFSYSIFLIASLLLLVLFARISFRKSTLLVFGFLLPHAILFALYLRWDETTALWQNFYAPNLTWQTTKFITWSSLRFLLLVPVIYFVISLFMLTREARFTKYQSQLFQVMFLWLMFALVQILLTRELTPHSFLPALPSLTYFISHYLLLIRRRWIAELMFWIFMISVLSISNLAANNKISSIDYSAMMASSTANATPKDEKVMVLGDSLPIYFQNKLGGYFLNWELSRETVANMNYYGNVLKVEDAFRKNTPDMVIDKENLMPGILNRIPSLQNVYRKEGRVYKRVNN